MRPSGAVINALAPAWYDDAPLLCHESVSAHLPCHFSCRHAEVRPDLPHSLANHGRLSHDLWKHTDCYCGHSAVEHAGLVARVQAAQAGPALLASPEVNLPSQFSGRS